MAFSILQIAPGIPPTSADEERFASRRFLFCESSLNFGGQEEQILRQMEALSAAGHFCLLACPAQSMIAAEASRRLIEWTDVRFRNSVHPASGWRIRSLLKRHRIDVALGHSGHDANILAISARLIHPRPTILRVRTYQPGRARARSFNRAADRTLVPSEHLRERILSNPDVDPSRIAVLRPLLPIDTLREEAKMPLPAQLHAWLATRSPVVVHAAMLRSEKGHRLALSAIARLRERFPEIGYVIAGSGPKEADLRRHAAKLGIEDNVCFAGFVSPVAALLARAAIVIMPSRNEPLGLAQLEALALGIPVAVSDAGGLPETVIDGETGWILPTENLDAWVQGLGEALENPAEAQARAATGRRMVENAYSPDAHLSALEQQILNAQETRRTSSRKSWGTPLAAAAPLEQELVAVAPLLNLL